MSSIDITRRKTHYPSGRKQEEFFLLSPEWVETIMGARVRLGGRKNLLILRNKINKYLESNE